MSEAKALRDQLHTVNEKMIAAIKAEDDASTSTSDPSADAESRELTELRSKVGMGAYVGAAMERRGVVNGAELELNQAFGHPR